MKRAALIAAVALALPAVPAEAYPGGEIGTLEAGTYICELPGDAATMARHVPDSDFDVVSGSSYRAKDTIGTYLLTGDHLVMTGGPFQGQQFQRISRGFLRILAPGGEEAEMRCVLESRTES
jgi:hypothetical protein